MQVNPYLSYDGNCGAALKFYEKVLGARIEETFPYGEGNAGSYHTSSVATEVSFDS